MSAISFFIIVYIVVVDYRIIRTVFTDFSVFSFLIISIGGGYGRNDEFTAVRRIRNSASLVRLRQELERKFNHQKVIIHTLKDFN